MTVVTTGSEIWFQCSQKNYCLFRWWAFVTVLKHRVNEYYGYPDG
jgi:hypothetical protein